MEDWRQFSCTETLQNGLEARIRALRADDRERLAKAFRLLDRESVYRRLFAFKSELTEADLDRLVRTDPEREAALVVTIGAGPDETIIGSGRFVTAATQGTDRTAELAFVVEEDYQGLGIAGRLLSHLAHIARSGGIAALEADVLADNTAMLAVFSKCGLPMQARHENGVVHVRLALRPEHG